VMSLVAALVAAFRGGRYVYADVADIDANEQRHVMVASDRSPELARTDSPGG
jgi:hypothetical protein